jgi:hypothetical protein
MKISFGLENSLDLLEIIVDTGIKDSILDLIGLKDDPKGETVEKKPAKQESTVEIGFNLIAGIVSGLVKESRTNPEMVYGFFGRCYEPQLSWKDAKRLPLGEILRLVAYIQKEIGDAKSFFASLLQKPQVPLSN